MAWLWYNVIGAVVVVVAALAVEGVSGSDDLRGARP
jgi:hypothetical protein